MLSVLLGCDDVSLGISFTTFRDTTIISSSTVWSFSRSFFVDVHTLEDKKTSCFETSRTKHRVKQRHVLAVKLCSLTHTAARTLKLANCQVFDNPSTQQIGACTAYDLLYPLRHTRAVLCEVICVTCVLPVTCILPLRGLGKVCVRNVSWQEELFLLPFNIGTCSSKHYNSVPKYKIIIVQGKTRKERHCNIFV